MKKIERQLKEYEENLVEVDNPSNEFVPLFKNLKQPTHVWYCADPYGDKPVLEKITTQQMSEIVFKKTGRKFNWFEGLLIPKSMEEHQSDEPVDCTDAYDKLYIADTGELGFALVARCRIEEGTKLTMYGGQIVTAQFADENQKEKNEYKMYSLAASGKSRKAPSFAKTTYRNGGILTFSQSSRHNSIQGCLFDHATSGFGFNKSHAVL